MKGRRDVAESSTAACRRWYQSSQIRKSMIAPTKAMLPTTIPATAPALREFDGLSLLAEVETREALVSVEYVEYGVD